MERTLKDRVAVVTGSGRGIGEAIARKLAAAGAVLAINDADPASADGTVEEIVSAGGSAARFSADIASSGQVEEMMRSVLERFGRIDILVNNAGVAGPSLLVRDTPPSSWERTFAVNTTGVFLCCRSVLPHMMERKSGRIVNISSLAGRRISKLGGADYTASKHAVIGFSKHLAFEAAAFGINVNVVCPGATLTPFTREKTTEAFREEVSRQIPLGRWIAPEDQADAVLFLVSDAACMITGQVLDVEGGQLLGLASDYREDLERRTLNSERNRSNLKGEV
jgi:NAD(P)-dependent dehydrogenase (short-subunit alcohol dehydrogenase family)